MYQNESQVRVRYAETDQMRYLYYGNYAQYYEIGRVELMRSLGLSYRDMEENYKVMMPVVSMHQRFIRPAFYDDLLTIRTTVNELPQTFITFNSEIFNEKGKLVNAGSVRLCFVDMNTGKTTPAPAFLLERISPFFT